jgi:hypothetical protein
VITAAVLLLVNATCTTHLIAQQSGRRQADPPLAASCVAENDPVVKTAGIVVQASPAVARVWPGYWSETQPFFLAVPGKHALLYSVAGGFPGFVPTSLPSGSEGTLYIACGTVEELGATRGFMDIEVPVADQVATAVHLVEDTRGTLEFLYHEAFHGYQNRNFAPPRPLVLDIRSEWVRRPEFQAMLEVERRILAAALAAQDSDSAAALTLRYLKVRAHRHNTIPEHVSVYETDLERTEGSAQIVGLTAAALALGEPSAQVAGNLQKELLEPLPDSRLGGEWIVRVRVYVTGAALAVLLDRFSTTWREDMERGAAAPALLRDALILAEPSLQHPLERILGDFGYEALLQKYAAQSHTPTALEVESACNGVIVVCRQRT